MKFDDMGAMAGAAMHKEPDELTAEERLAIAFMAGCEVETAWEGPKAVVRTRYPVGLQKLDGQWRVSEFRGQRHPSE